MVRRKRRTAKAVAHRKIHIIRKGRATRRSNVLFFLVIRTKSFAKSTSLRHKTTYPLGASDALALGKRGLGTNGGVNLTAAHLAVRVGLLAVAYSAQASLEFRVANNARIAWQVICHGECGAAITAATSTKATRLPPITRCLASHPLRVLLNARVTRLESVTKPASLLTTGRSSVSKAQFIRAGLGKPTLHLQVSQ